MGGRRWVPFVLLAPFQFIFGLVYSWGTIAPAIHTQSGWSHATLDLTFSLTPLALLPAIILSGYGLQRMTPKTMLALSLCCLTLGGSIGLIPGTPIPFMVGYSIVALGVGAGLSTASCIALVSRLYPAHRGTLGGALLALYGMSSMASAPLFETLDNIFGWRLALTLIFAAYAAVGWLAWAYIPSTPINQAHQTTRLSLWHIVRHRRVILAIGIIVIATPLGSASLATIGSLCPDLGFSPRFAVLAVSMMALGNGLGRLGFGMLADRRSAYFSRSAVLAVNAVAAMLLLLTLHGIGQRLFVAYPLMIGLAFGGMAGNLPALAAHGIEQNHLETVFGLLFGTFALASFLGPLISAALGTQIALEWLAFLAVIIWFLAALHKEVDTDFAV